MAMEKEPKTYEIRTISDLMRVVNNENCDRLVKDLSAWLALMSIAKSLAAKEGVDLDADVQCGVFRWIDDGEHDITVTMQDGSGNAVEIMSTKGTKKEEEKSLYSLGFCKLNY